MGTIVARRTSTGQRTEQEESMKFLRLFSASAAGLFMLLGLTLSAVQAQAEEIKWERIVGLQVAGDLVGVGSGQVTGAAPWTTTDGRAKVDLKSGKVKFKVQGLVLAVGSASADQLFGLGIGTPAGVTEVEGTLVCNVDGTVGMTGNSVVVDTDSVALDAQGDAQFNGRISIPAACSSAPDDTAFLIRIVLPKVFAGAYIAFGAVRVP
jgi:hypothetical protein